MFNDIYDMWTPMHTFAFCVLGLKYVGFAMILYAAYRQFNPITSHSMDLNPWWKVWWQKTFTPSGTPEGMAWAKIELARIEAQIAAEDAAKRSELFEYPIPYTGIPNCEDESELEFELSKKKLEDPNVITLEDIGGNIYVVPEKERTI